MYSALSSLGKNLILLGILALSAINFFYGWFGWKDLLAIQSLAGLAYVFLSCYEFLNAQYKASLPVQRYSYFTGSYVMFKVLKIGAYLSFGAMLYFSGSRMKYIYPICVTIALTEALVIFLKYKKGICFVSIYANYLLFSQDKLSRIFANEIVLVEFRHDIFYFIKRNGKSLQVNLMHIEEKEKFVSSMNEWLKRNKVNIGSESEAKLISILTELN
jgi:hypothetical protein